MFLSKFVFSALIDADRTNTRLFEENKSEEVVPCRVRKILKDDQRILEHHSNVVDDADDDDENEDGFVHVRQKLKLAKDI